MSAHPSLLEAGKKGGRGNKASDDTAGFAERGSTYFRIGVRHFFRAIFCSLYQGEFTPKSLRLSTSLECTPTSGPAADLYFRRMIVIHDIFRTPSNVNT